jgi:sorbitol-specific phosphotransferase system component IIC
MRQPADLRARQFILGNAIGFTIISFASYFDVYSHAHIFVGVDPWYNPAHIMIYAGILIILITALKLRKYPDPRIKLSLAGIVVMIAAGILNEIWHRVLLFGNPRPEPFPIEPPHALLA